MLNVTEREMEVLEVIKNTMEMYGDGFSDVMIEDIVSETGFNTQTVKGLLGSLYKKDYVEYMDVNGEYNVYYLIGEALEHFDLGYLE